MPRGPIIATNHSAFTVADLDAAVAFFRDVMGFTATAKTHQVGPAVDGITGFPGAELDIVYIQAPGHKIELMQYYEPKGKMPVTLRPCDPGFAHLAFEVADADAWVEAVAKAGYIAIGPTQTLTMGPRKGGKTVYVRGPDGITLEFQQPPPAP